MNIRDVPVTLVCGHLGAGKTTALLALLAQRPDGERWAVLVNEFGKVGIDGDLLEADGAYAVRQIPGGCVCCSSGPQLQMHLVRLLRDEVPDRVLIEPTGLALPGAIIDMLRRPGMRDAVSLRAVISLVDIRRAQDEFLTEMEAFHAQVDAADVLVGTHADVATAAQREAFGVWASQLWPPKVQIVEAQHGVLDPALLDLDPVAREREPLHHHHTHVRSVGWRYPVSSVFDRARLVTTLQSLVQGDAAIEGLLRIKGVFRTDRGWLLVQGTDLELAFRPFQHRRDSRVEFLVSDSAQVAEEAVAASLEEALLKAARVDPR